MGFRYQELKERGDSIELERRESFTTERSHNGYIKRRKTIVRERFPHPNVKELKSHKKQQPLQREVQKTIYRQGTESGRTTTETFVYSPGSGTLLGRCRDKSNLQRAVNRTSVQLKRLAQEIDNEMAKLKRERDKLMLRPRTHPLMRNAAIQNDKHCQETTTNVNINRFNDIADNIEFTIEKVSSQHKFVCTSPRNACDEQISCRPRMRTIGLQKDTQRNSIYCNSVKKVKAKLDTAKKNKSTNLANSKAKEELIDSAPPKCYAFDYGGTGDGQNAMEVYHLQNCCCAGRFSQNDCNCQKICERYNSVGNHNGMLCNKNTYVEKGITPCSEYNYCHDEYRYNYSQQNASSLPCQPCVQFHSQCPPCIRSLAPCPTYNEREKAKSKTQVIYGRRMSDLNTDEFYHPTGSSPTKHMTNKHGNTKHSHTKERLMVEIGKDGRTSIDIEKHGRTHSKTRSRPEIDEAANRNSYEARSSHKSNAGSSEKTRISKKDKEKLLEITFTKERRRKASSESGDEVIPYELQKIDREYTRDERRSMKQMTITAYTPCKPVESEYESHRNIKKIHGSKEKDDDTKSDDDKTWDERLRRTGEQPRVEQPREDDGRKGIPTITEFYDNYRVGEAWEADEDNIVRQAYVEGYRNPLEITKQRSFDIMPVPKDTVRGISPSQSPERGRRSVREVRRYANKPKSPGTSQKANDQFGAERGSKEEVRRYMYSIPRGSQKPSSKEKSTVKGDYESEIVYAHQADPAYTPNGKPRLERDSGANLEPKSDNRYIGQNTSHKAYYTGGMSKSENGYTESGKPNSAPENENSEPKYRNNSPRRKGNKTSEAVGNDFVYNPDGKPISARGFDSETRSGPNKGYVTDKTRGNYTRSPRNAQAPVYRSHNSWLEDHETTDTAGDDVVCTSHGKPRSSPDSGARVPETFNRYVGEDPSHKDQYRSGMIKSESGYAENGKLTSGTENENRGATSWRHDDKTTEASGDEFVYTADEKPPSARGFDPKTTHGFGEGYVADKSRNNDTGIIYTDIYPLNNTYDSDSATTGAIPHINEGKSVSDRLYDELKATQDLKNVSEVGFHDGHGTVDENSQIRHIQDRDMQSKTKEGYIEPSTKYTNAGKADLSNEKVRHQRNVDQNKEYEGKLKDAKPEFTGKSPKNTIRSSGDSKTFRNAPVPEIHIEDPDESLGSEKNERAGSLKVNLPEQTKFAIKGEMVLDVQLGSEKLMDGRTIVGRYTNPDQFDDTEKPASPDGIIASSDLPTNIATLKIDVGQQLSPFPSLESPRIYMRSRNSCSDYKNVCLPPSSDCTHKSSPRRRCVENAGDVYMSYDACSPSSASQCLPPERSFSEIPFEKLGDQNTHSPVRQLAANSHLDVALQLDAARGNYIPSPQPKMSTSCIYLRSTGTQYSATIIENREDRCAPQYIPLPKECSHKSIEEREDSQESCWAQSCDKQIEELQSASYIPQTNYKILCDEEYKIQQELEEQPHNPQENSQKFNSKNYFFSRQHEQKLIPGQPINDCDIKESGVQRPRIQNFTERRTPRFNATMPPHPEMPEEDDRCAEEMPLYKPQPRVKFMEKNLLHYDNTDQCGYSQREEPDCQTESRAGFLTRDCEGFNRREYQQIPKFTGCPCMLKTYLSMIAHYYPDYRAQIEDNDSAEGECAFEQ